MKLKKGLLIVLLVVISMICVLLQPISSYAATPLYLGITELKMDSNMGYAIGNPGTAGTTSTAAKIWNIVKYSTETSNDPTEANIYCLKAGVGFTNVSKRATYDVFYDMKKQKQAISEQNDILKKLVEGKIELDNGSVINQYSAILAILDLFYYDKTSTEADKIALLQDANCLLYTSPSPRDA